MQTIEINGSIRGETGKSSSRSLRQRGQVPCVMYGGEKNVHFHAPEKKFMHLVHTSEVYLLKLQLDGGTYEALLQDVQFHPVTESIMHMDFLQVFPDREVVVNVPIKLTGNSVGLLSGGKLRQRRRHIRVSGLLKDIPEHLEVDMTDVEIGHFIKIQDLSYENLRILDPPKAMVAGVVSSRLVAKGLRAPEEIEEVAEKAVEEVEGEEEEPAKATDRQEQERSGS